MKKLLDVLKDCEARLNAMADCNREVMDADDLGSLLTTIQEVKSLQEVVTENNQYNLEVPEEDPDLKRLKEFKDYMDSEFSLMGTSDEADQRFYGLKVSIRFGDKVLDLDNCAPVFTGIQDCLDYIVDQW